MVLRRRHYRSFTDAKENLTGECENQRYFARICAVFGGFRLFRCSARNDIHDPEAHNREFTPSTLL